MKMNLTLRKKVLARDEFICQKCYMEGLKKVKSPLDILFEK